MFFSLSILPCSRAISPCYLPRKRSYGRAPVASANILSPEYSTVAAKCSLPSIDCFFFWTDGAVDGVGFSSKNMGVGVASQHVSLGAGPLAREPTASLRMGSNDDLWVCDFSNL